MTSTHQPADMGKIASLKVGYKSKMLRMLLNVFDIEGGYEAAAKARKQIKRGCRGLEYGGKATILGAMLIIKDIWSKSQKYATEEGICRCWRMAGILPLAMETEINKDLGHAGTPLVKKTLTQEACNELCSLLNAVKLQTKARELDTNSVAVALQESSAGKLNIEDKILMDMFTEWVEVEDDALRKLTITCKKLGVPEAATVHLDRFKKALFKAKAGKKKKNTPIHDFFQPGKKPKNN